MMSSSFEWQEQLKEAFVKGEKLTATTRTTAANITVVGKKTATAGATATKSYV